MSECPFVELTKAKRLYRGCHPDSSLYREHAGRVEWWDKIATKAARNIFQAITIAAVVDYSITHYKLPTNTTEPKGMSQAALNAAAMIKHILEK